MRDRQQERMLAQVQELEFALLELHLYLDTHPEDAAALATFNELLPRFHEARRAYEAAYGPLGSFGHTSRELASWTWTAEPWPWELDA